LYARALLELSSSTTKCHRSQSAAGATASSCRNGRVRSAADATSGRQAVARTLPAASTTMIQPARAAQRRCTEERIQEAADAVVRLERDLATNHATTKRARRQFEEWKKANPVAREGFPRQCDRIFCHRRDLQRKTRCPGTRPVRKAASTEDHRF